jgi:uncharacterized protein YjbI with pentapeptide repeats
MADLTRADLTGANLTGANLAGATLNGAELREANLCGTDLTVIDGLTQEQLDWARGDQTTKIPNGLTWPEHWTQ